MTVETRMALAVGDRLG